MIMENSAAATMIGLIHLSIPWIFLHYLSAYKQMQPQPMVGLVYLNICWILLHHLNLYICLLHHQS